MLLKSVMKGWVGDRDISRCCIMGAKEPTLERADFTLQLLMFVIVEKEGQMFIIFFLSIFCQLLSPRF